MSKQAYIAEVDALRASPALRAKVASLPNRRRRRPRSFSWVGLASALVLVVGLGVAAPAILRAIAPPGGQLDPPPVVTQSPVPEGIIAEGIDVSPVILDAAREYVRERYAYQSEHNAAPVLVDGEFQAGPVAIFDNWRIESLTVAYERKELGTYTVAVYQLDYRLHTTTPERVVLAGAAEVDGEGWYLDTYPGCTYLVFLLDYSSPHYFATMLNDCSPGSALFDESLLQDIETYLDRLKGEESPPEASTAPYAMQGVSINEIDYTALEQQMTAEEWKALQPYLPVLRDGGSFYKVWEDDHTGEKMGPVEMTLDEFYQERFGLDSPDGKLDLEKLTLFGFEGDGTQDLILGYFNGGGNYLILHREEEKIYGTERGYRSFMQLQTEGTFMGSAGADDNYYYRLAFQHGRFVEELLGYKTGAYCEIGGISVSEEYFTNWRENLMGRDMWWYNPAEQAPVEGVRAFLADYPISTYGPSEYSDFGVLSCAPVTDYQDPEYPKALTYHVVLQHGMMDRYFLFDQEHRLLGTRSTPEFTLTIDGKPYPLGIGTRGIFGTPTGTNSVPIDDGQWQYEMYSEWFAPEAANAAGYCYYPNTGEYRLSGINTIREDVSTYRGIHVGSTVAELLEAYPECNTGFGDQTHSLTYSDNNSLNLEFYFQNDPAANRETILTRKIENINLSASFW